jgi:methylenetetrahydrofolate dehydrogenase (NADP+)/methenyltetrahydrofolate cyclohydrolase
MSQAKIIDGKAVSTAIKEKVAAEIAALKEKGIDSCLAVILVGDDPASRVYVNNKKKACEFCGIESLEYTLPAETTQEELLDLIKQLNADKKVNGILVQLPLPKHINEDAVIATIDPSKDVDAFHPVNVGKIMQGTCKLLPCTPAGIMELIASTDIPVTGKDCVVIGRSNIVGKPMAMLLLHKNGTVTICHSKTKDLKDKCKSADILVAAVGIPNFVTADMVKEGAVVIDVGINRMEDGKLCGDVDFDGVSEIAGAITPVPGGVGPMTIAMLMNNTLIATKDQNHIQ